MLLIYKANNFESTKIYIRSCGGACLLCMEQNYVQVSVCMKSKSTHTILFLFGHIKTHFACVISDVCVFWVNGLEASENQAFSLQAGKRTMLLTYKAGRGLFVDGGIHGELAHILLRLSIGKSEFFVFIQ